MIEFGHMQEEGSDTMFGIVAFNKRELYCSERYKVGTPVCFIVSEIRPKLKRAIRVKSFYECLSSFCYYHDSIFLDKEQTDYVLEEFRHLKDCLDIFIEKGITHTESNNYYHNQCFRQYSEFCLLNS